MDKGTIPFRNARELADSFAGTWDFEYQQLGAAAEEGFCRFARDDSGIVYEECFPAAIGLRGTLAEGLFAVHLTDERGRSGRWQGRDAPAHAFAYADPRVDVDVVIPQGTRNVAALLPLEAAHEWIERLSGIPVSRLLPDGHFFRALDPRCRRGLLEELRTLLQEPPHTRRLGLAIAESVVRSLHGVDVPAGPPNKSARSTFRRAMELWEEGDPRVSPAELALRMDISLRSLELAFHACMDMPPARYLRSLRLNRVHDRLLAMEPDEGFVGAVALDFGFVHLGRFAGEYRALFGESPSETLGRRPPTRAIRVPGLR